MNEQILELRYRPNARIIDYRGELAELIAEQLNLPRWRVSQDRVDVFDESHRHRAFVSHRNVGFSVQDSATSNYFGDKAGQFLRFVADIEPVGKTWTVLRLGVRSKFCSPVELDFEEAVERFNQRYSVLTPQAEEAIAADVEDFGSTLELRDQHGWFKLQIGPMAEDQLGRFFKDRDEYPDVGIYCDIDYALTDQEVTVDDAIRFLRATAQASWERRDRLERMLLAE